MDSCRAWHEAAPVVETPGEGSCSLGSLHKGARGTVSAIDHSSAVSGALDSADEGIVRRLMELGFVPGEPIEIIEEQRPGGDPIAVRIGGSIFALRRREAQAVMVRLALPA
ncbi:MAG TPA: FeoA family protein [Steroidobacteraceae bacterium]|jgi:ferrous iron transport protein A